jgi:excisionase family DNA binding protein
MVANPSIVDTLKGTRRLLTRKELAVILGISQFTLWRWSKEGRIPSVRVAGMLRFDPVKVAAALITEVRG